MNAFVNALSSESRDVITELSVGDVVKFDYVGYKRYDSFNKTQPLEVIEVGRGPTGNLIFRGKQPKKSVYSNDVIVETPFLSATYFKVVSRAKRVVQVEAEPTDVDVVILDAISLKVEKMCSTSRLQQAVDDILRKDMNKKLIVFTRYAEVSVGELPINWAYSK